jgi:hypothetical protein
MLASSAPGSGGGEKGVGGVSAKTLEELDHLLAEGGALGSTGLVITDSLYLQKNHLNTGGVSTDGSGSGASLTSPTSTGAGVGAPSAAASHSVPCVNDDEGVAAPAAAAAAAAAAVAAAAAAESAYVGDKTMVKKDSGYIPSIVNAPEHIDKRVKKLKKITNRQKELGEPRFAPLVTQAANRETRRIRFADQVSGRNLAQTTYTAKLHYPAESQVLDQGDAPPPPKSTGCCTLS